MAMRAIQDNAKILWYPIQLYPLSLPPVCHSYIQGFKIFARSLPMLQNQPLGTTFCELIIYTSASLRIDFQIFPLRTNWRIRFAR